MCQNLKMAPMNRKFGILRWTPYDPVRPKRSPTLSIPVVGWLLFSDPPRADVVWRKPKSGSPCVKHRRAQRAAPEASAASGGRRAARADVSPRAGDLGWGQTRRAAGARATKKYSNRRRIRFWVECSNSRLSTRSRSWYFAIFVLSLSWLNEI